MISNMHRHRRGLVEAETGLVPKRRSAGSTVALVYPNTYHVGMSNLGFQTVYRLLNDLDDIVCERAFLPDLSFMDMDDIITIESGRSIAVFDIIAFSLAFENDYPNLLTILQKANIPFKSTDRDHRFPLIMAGGVTCALNPEPIAIFMDCFLIGEAETILPQFMTRHLVTEKRTDLLKSAAQEIKGVYVPSLYRDRYETDGTFRCLEPQANVPATVQRAFVADIEQNPTCSSILTPNTTFNDTYLIEVSRGCPHGCRFCAAGFVYRPPRFRSLSLLEACLDNAPTASNKIGLVGAAVSDLPGIEDLCAHASDADVRLSFSSLRVDALGNRLIDQLKKSKVKTATIAPDAGSERLRRCINKGIPEDPILAATEALVTQGIPNLKLYFMIGLPTETMDDIEAIVKLCKKIKHHFLKASRPQKRIGEITVSVNSFVPKPHTPFQWAAMDETRLLKQKLRHIKNKLKRVANMRIHSDIPRWAFIQALLSRGDRRVAELLLLAHMNDGNWAKTFKSSPVNPDFYVLRERALDENFPWDFIDHGIKKSFLRSEYKKALASQETDPCRVDTCKLCGVCNSSPTSQPG